VLFRSEEDPTLKQLRKSKTLFFSPYYGMVYYLLALAALYYIGSKMQAKDIVNGLIQTQMFIIVLPVALILKAIKQYNLPILRLNKPKPANFLLVPIIAVCAAILVSVLSHLINLVYPFPKEYLAKMEELLKMPDLKLWQMYLLIAVMPGVCEELMFRGFLIRFFEKQGMWVSIVITAFLFALFHLDPYKFLPVFLLGIMLGYLAVKSNSLYMSMYAHAINNAVAVTAVQYAGLPLMKSILEGSEVMQGGLVFLTILVMIGALITFNKLNKSNELGMNR
jgi:membrane protease YdiL (CAAX protease family)